jgi:predicted glycogen debranching enzyme
LLAAMHPPVDRMQLVAKLDETAHYDAVDYALGTNRWASGATEPQGYVHIESFRLDGTTSVWRFAIGDALLEKRVWMRHGENTTCVQYSMLRGSQSIELELRTFINYRDFHSNTHAGDWRMKIDAVPNGLQVTAFEGAIPFYLPSAGASRTAAWWPVIF